ncbi:ribbon-helix-helix domain-containing protein [Labrys neptuniae]
MDKEEEFGQDERKVVGTTLHLNQMAWHQLKLIALKEGKTQQAVLVEAVNLLFDSRGMLEIAEAGKRGSAKKLLPANRGPDGAGGDIS